MLATKYSLTLDPRDPNAGGNHRKSLVRSLEQSLRRLRTDYVDLLWLHMRDATTPIEEAVRALDDQVRLGKVLYVGISDSPAWVAAQANTIADLRGWSPFVALQVPYSVASRDPERELLPMAASLGLDARAVGRARRGHPHRQAGRRAPLAGGPGRASETEALVELLRRIAADHDATPAQVAIAWLLGAPGPPTDRADRRRPHGEPDRSRTSAHSSSSSTTRSGASSTRPAPRRSASRARSSSRTTCAT